MYNGILPCGEVDQEYIQSLTTGHTAKFTAMIYLMSGDSEDTTSRINKIFTRLYSEGRETDLLDVLRLCHYLLGLEYPEAIEDVCSTPQGQRYYLFCLMMSLDEAMLDILAG